MTQISEPNTLLEINEAHANNFILVIPKLPSAQFLSSVFADLTKRTGNTTNTSGTSGINSDDCRPVNNTQLEREHNLDLTNFKLYISGFSTPSVNIANYKVDTQFASLSRAGKIQFGDFNTTMQISENFLNYNLILYWMYMIHNPEERNKTSGRDLIDNIFTDIYVIITNNHRQKVAEYKFLDAFPIALPTIQFTYQNANKITADISWAHSGMYATNNFVLKYV